MGAPLLALACPPSKTWTTGPDEQGDFVLAEGGSAAVRMAGPFEVPWALALLPDGSFLVTERPGRLQHVRSNAETKPVAGIHLWPMSGMAAADVAADPAEEIICPFVHRQGRGVIQRMARFDDVKR
jgi:glucose/arabinose dehydrogenase